MPSHAVCPRIPCTLSPSAPVARYSAAMVFASFGTFCGSWQARLNGQPAVSSRKGWDRGRSSRAPRYRMRRAPSHNPVLLHFVQPLYEPAPVDTPHLVLCVPHVYVNNEGRSGIAGLTLDALFCHVPESDVVLAGAGQKDPQHECRSVCQCDLDAHCQLVQVLPQQCHAFLKAGGLLGPGIHSKQQQILHLASHLQSVQHNSLASVSEL